MTVAVAVAVFALKNRSAHIRYLLWLIVLAKCLLPPLLTIPLAILPQQAPTEPIQVFLPAGMPALDHEVVDTAIVKSLELSSASLEATSVPMVRERATKKTVREWVAIVWMIGMGVYLVMNLLRALRANYWLWRKRQALSAELQTDIENMLSSYNFKRFPGIYLIDEISQPFVWGLLRGSIYLPTNFSDIKNPEHQRNVLGHELSHILRFDAAINLLQVIAQAIFWFHPFVWWANKKIRAEREKCCDEMAIARLNALPKDYGTAILNILAAKHKSTRPVPSLAVAGPAKNIEERIKTMLRPGKKFYKHPSLIAAITVFWVAFLTVPTTVVLTAQEEIEAPKLQTKSTQPLHEAAAVGDTEKVKSLISKGADVNEKNEEGRTALHCACEKSHAEVGKLLISKGAYVNAVGWWKTPLHFAAMSGNKQTVELLLSKGADINAKDRYGGTPLFETMKSSAAGSKEVVKFLVSKGAKVPEFHLGAYLGDTEKLKKCLQDAIDINSQGNFCCTALHAAANSGKKNIVEFLISKGADVDAKDARDLTPLYYAAIHNDGDIADLLLSKGADVNAKDRGGYCTLLYYAIWDHSKDAIKLLISKGANVNVKDNYGYTPLVYAIWGEDKDMVELLISKGADVNAEDNDGYTALYWAAMEGLKDMVELLIAKGAAPVSTIHVAASLGDLPKVKSFIEAGTDVNVRDKLGRTPLYWAVRTYNGDVAKFLIAKGADVNARDNRGVTPLFAIGIRSGGKKDLAELLISKGADVNAKDERGSTPLHPACARGQKDVVELLIAKGADVNAKTTGGRTRIGSTPLHGACWYGHTDVAELLIAKGADINIQNNDSRTPLHEACLYGDEGLVSLLIAKGVDINAKDNKEQTALSLAKEQGREEIVELLRKHGARE